MPDPVSNLDIDDVLSSIRRLVAEGDRPVTSRPEARPVQRTETAPGKLVLTPAFRVREPEPRPAPEEAAPEEAAPVPAPTAAEPAPEPAEAEPPEVGSGPAGPRVQPTLVLDAAERTDLRTSGAAAMPHGDSASGPETGAGPDAISEEERRADLRSRLEATIAELEAAMTLRSDEWEPDGSEAQPVMDWSDAGARETRLFTRHPSRFSREVEDAEEVADPVDDPAPAEAAPEPEPPAAEAMLDEAPVDPEDEPLAADGGDATATAWLEDETLIDEAALRRMVADVVREELQGELGERITRNVRKLVRREIYRVLATENLT